MSRTLDQILYGPLLAQLVVTDRCNLTCRYCNEYERDGRPVPITTVKARLRHLKALGTVVIEITGGEPMTHPDIYEIVSAARRLGLRTTMISNAFLFNEARIRALNTAGLQELQVSVDGVRPNADSVKVLDVVRGKLAVLARVARFKVVLSAVVGAAPPAEVFEVIAFAKEHHFRPRVLYLHGHDGQLKLTPEQLALNREIGRAIGSRFGEGRDYRTRLATKGEAPFKCRSGSRYVYVDTGGMVRWCSQTRDVFGIPLERYDFAELRRQFRTQKSCNPKCTVGCARHTSAVDWWRPQPLHAAP